MNNKDLIKTKKIDWTNNNKRKDSENKTNKTKDSIKTNNKDWTKISNKRKRKDQENQEDIIDFNYNLF